MLLKMRSNTYIFGGPVVPPYVEAVCVVCDILMSAEYDQLIGHLRKNCRHFTEGALALHLAVLGGETPIVSILVGDEGDTLNAGSFLFDRGFYVQSVCFPAVPYHAGVLRVQVNANHTSESINGLLNALADLKRKTPLPGPQELARQAA
jgi:7-keto-8-aminopelargonate synthetase-like enzyme